MKKAKKEKRKKSERKVVREKKWCTFAPAFRKASKQWFRCERQKEGEKKKTLKKVCGNEKVVVCLPPVSTKGQKREVNKIEKVL